MKRIIEKLRADNGSALIEAMFAILITTAAITGLASLAVYSSAAVGDAQALAARQQAIATLATTFSNDVNAVSTGATTQPMTIDGDESDVTFWRTNDNGVNIIHVAVVRDPENTGVDCSTINDLPTGCLVAQSFASAADPETTATPIAVAWVGASLEDDIGVTVAPGELGDFTPPAAAAQTRFVFKVFGSTHGDTLTFTNAADDTVLTTVTVTTADQYLYGDIDTSIASDVRITWTGSSTTVVSHFTVYGAPE